MTFEDIRKAAEGHFKANWPHTPVQWENVPFDPPQEEAWVRLTILHAPSLIETQGSGGFNRIVGLIVVSIFVPLDSGTRRARQYADMVYELFNRKRIGGLYFSATTVRDIGPDPHGPWHHMAVSTPFWCFR